MTINNPIIVHGLDDLDTAAAAVAQAMEATGCTVVTFDGEMGAGKTTLIRRIVDRLGADGSDSANSPSFAIANDYGTDSAGRTVYHFDLYRLESAEETLDIGFEDYLDSGDVCLIEWPDRAEELLPLHRLNVAITLLPDRSRAITVEEL